MQEHQEKLNNYCDICQEDLFKKYDFILHNKNVHSNQWNCQECDFQASTREILLKHCKIAVGHQPSMGQKQRLGQTGVMECYTCKSEFRTYHDLMNHRKQEHPSHKKCRYYVKRECVFSSDECWYLHEDNVNGNPLLNNHQSFQCFVCKNEFMSKHDLMDHKKKHHPSKMLCTKFQNGICDRSEEKCRYIHSNTDTNKTTTSPKPNAWDKPLSTLWEQDFHHTAQAAPPDQGALVKALIMLNQRMESMEKRMFPIQI